jgi:hypothetical protein
MKQLTRPLVATMLLSLALVLGGCAPAHRTEERTAIVSTVYTTPPRNDTEAIQRFAMQLQTAPDATTEAEVLRNLHQYEVDHNLTYKVQAVRLDTNTPVAAPATHPYPIRVDVQIFKGEIPLYTISFVPRDNRNAALLGE